MTKSVFTAKYKRFRKLLIGAREEAGVTQQDLADKVGWTQTDISKVERGVRRLDLIEFLEFAKALGIDTQSFIGRLERE